MKTSSELHEAAAKFAQVPEIYRHITNISKYVL